MHIGFVTHLSSYGGIAVYTRTMAKALTEYGHKVSIITAGGDEYPYSVKEKEGVRTFKIPNAKLLLVRRVPILYRHARAINFLLFSCKSSKIVSELEEEEKLDFVEFAEAGGDGYCYIKKKRRIPVIVRCHTPTFILQKYYESKEMLYDVLLTLCMEKYCIRNADILTAPSFDMARTIAKECNLSENKFSVFPNPLDIDQFISPLSKSHPIDVHSKINILHVGRLERIKGIELLISAIPVILEKVPNAWFYFIGAGSSQEATQEWKKRLEKVSKNQIVFLGRVDDETLSEYYRLCDMAIVPSINYESFSYTCAQAMAAGLPVVASRIGGIPETLGNNLGGILFEPNDVQGFIKAVVELSLSYERRKVVGMNGRKKAMNEFDSKTIAMNYINLLEKITF